LHPDGPQLRGPKGLATGGGHVFVSDCYNSFVKKFSVETGALLGAAGGYGEAEGQLRYPHGLALSPEGSLFVADCGNARISVFDASDMSFKFCFFLHRGATQAGKEVERMSRSLKLFGGSPANAEGLVRSPTVPSVAKWVAQRDDVIARESSAALTSKFGSKWVAKASPMARELKAAALTEGEFGLLGGLRWRQQQLQLKHPRASLRPSGMAIEDGELFVCDAFSRRLQVFDLSGNFLRFLTPTHLEGADRGKLLLVNPQGVVAVQGRLCVSDRRGDALYLIDKNDGRPIQGVPFLVNRPRGLSGLCTDGGSRVFVVGTSLASELVHPASHAAQCASRGRLDHR